jgi:hypothetical protein
MDHHGLVKRVKPEYEQVIKNTPVSHKLMRLTLSLGEVIAAFKLVDMQNLNAAMEKIHRRRGIKSTIEMQRVLKPLALEIRRRFGFTSAMEWSALGCLGESAEPEKGRQYPIYLLGLPYLWKVRPAKPDVPYDVLVPQFDLDAKIGVIDTGEVVTL